MNSLRQRRLLLEACEPRLVLAGVPELIELHPTGASNPADFVQVGGLAFFTAADGTNGRELWKTDGTPAGTVMVKDILPGSESSDPTDLMAFQGQVYFAASDGATGRELWRSDGTAQGTVMVRDINPGDGYQYPYGEGHLNSFPKGMVVVGDRLLLAAEESTTGTELWSSDGTQAGTTQVKDLATGSMTNSYGTYPDSSNPQQLLTVNGTLYFTADDGENGRELWKSDGTAAGTVMVKDIFPGSYPYYYDGNYYGIYPNQSRPTQLTAVNGVLFFAATDEAHGAELWRSDGTGDGTVLVKDINPGTPSSVAGDNSLLEFDGRLLLAADTADQGKELWSSDGTDAGTQLVKDIRPGSAAGIASAYLTELDGEVFFAADDGVSGSELWKTDGTGAGTLLVKNLDGSSSGSFPRYLTVANGRLYFSAFTAGLGREIWESDGTAAGTSVAADLAAETASSTPRDLFAFGEQLLFSAENGSNGRELYVMQTGDEPAEVIPALPDSYQVAEDGALAVATGEGVLANDGDEQTGPLTATLVANPAHGTVTLNPDGSFSYTPTPNYAGPDSFTYRAAEGQVTSDVVQVTIAVQGVNDPPAPAADSYATTEDTALTVDAAHGVLENDEDVDGNPLTASLVNQPTHGTLTLNADGSFTYTPAANFSGSDSFAYRVSDGTVQSEPVSVVLTITAADDAPSAVADSYTVNEDSVLNVAAAQGVLANDTDADGDVTVTVTQAPTHGTLTLNADGSFAYTPSANFAGTDSFTYTLSDGVNQSTAAATITIVDQADPPTATNDTLTVAGDGSSHTLDVLANDSFAPDADESLTVVSVTQGSQGGTVTLSNGQVSYRPANGFTGTETFQYTIEDSDELTSTATVTVTVSDTAGNRISGFVYRDRDGDGMRDANEMGVPGVLITLNGTATGGGTIDRSAITGDDGSYLFANVPAGTYEVRERQPTALADGAESSGVTGADVATNDRIGNLVVSGDQSFAANNFAERQFHSAYVSIAWFFASATSTSDVFRESMADAEASAGEEGLAEAIRNGGTTPPVDTNRPPLAGADTYSTAQDTPLNVDVAAGVLANDSDPDGDAITATIVTSVEHGSVTLGANGSFSYTPAAGFSGADGFSYRASDGTLTSGIVQVTLNVTSVSATAPVAVADTYTVLHNTTLTVDSASGLLKNDTDDDGNSLTAIKVTDPTHGTLTLNANGSFVYVPNNSFSGTDSFTYQASDGGRTSSITTVTLTVNAPNSAPVPTNDIYFVTRDTTLTVNAATGVLINDDDAQDDSLTATLIQTTTNGTLTFNSNGSFTYVPNAGFVGSDSFTYSASDGLLSSNAATVTISVTSTNTPPVALNDAYTVDQDGTLNVTSASGVLANDEDNELANMTAQLVAGPTNGTVNLMANGSFTYTPAAGFSGSDSFTYRANDGLADSNTATVTITVNDVNDLPQAVNDEFTVIQGNQLMIGAVMGVLINDTDLDDDSLTATLVTAPANGTLTLNADGSFQYVPNTGFFGTDSFTYQAHDGQGASNAATVTVHVTPLNEFRLIENTSAGTLVGQLNPTDPDLNGQLIFQIEDAQLPALLRLVPDDHRTGSPTSSLVLIAYIDFQSPASATYHAILEQLADEFNGELLIVRRHLPVTQEHGNALAAAIAAEAAGAQGRFNEMADVLFEQQQDWADEVDPQAAFEDYATQLGLNPTQFIEDLNDASLAARVQRDRDAATQLGATTTPAIYLEGELLSQLPLSFDEFRGLIQTQLDQVDAVFRINAATGQILVRDRAALDFETTPTFQLPVRITDLDGDTEVVQAVINLTDAGENVPVANPDTYTLDEDSVLTVAGVNGILANDVDDDGDSLLPNIVANVTHGTLTLQLNGAFTYTPDENFNGTDSFTYRVSDGQATSATTTVTLNVTPVNELPVAVDDNYSVQMNSILAVEATAGVLVNDSDPDDDPLIVQLVNQPSHGTLLLAADGTFQYTPDNEFVGTDSFMYQANDGLDDSNTATVTITVSPLDLLGEGEEEGAQASAFLSAGLVDQAMADWADEQDG